MNARFTSLLLALLLAGFTACKPTSQEVNPDQPPADSLTQGPLTAVGQPQGSPTIQTVGPEGGTITTPDGKLTLNLPAGALTKATTITIQPITNTAPNGVGQSYRFAPDGLQFVKPATLTLHYSREEVAVNHPDMLFMAFQTSDQRWQGVEGSQVDTTRLQISAPMPHFSNWSDAQQADILDLRFDDNSLSTKGTKEDPLKPGESTDNLSVSRILSGYTPNDKQVLEESGYKWSVIGGDQNGQLVLDGPNARYVAPAQTPVQNPVTVMVEISFKNHRGKVYLLKNIYLQSNSYFRGSIDGVAFDWPVFSYSRTAANGFLIIGSPQANWVPNIQFNVISGASDPAGFYPYTDQVQAGSVRLSMRTNGEVGNGLLNLYYQCGAEVVISPGGLHIDKMERSNGMEFIEGHLSGTVYRAEGKCPDLTVKQNELIVEFRIGRKVSQ